MNWASAGIGFAVGFGLFVIMSGSFSFYVAKHPRVLFRYMNRNKKSNKQPKRVA